jgi:hypothetical protein
LPAPVTIVTLPSKRRSAMKFPPCGFAVMAAGKTRHPPAFRV